MKILLDMTPCGRGTSIWVYALRILKSWRDADIGDVKIRLLIKEEAEQIIQTEFPNFEYVVFKPYTYSNSVAALFRYSWFIVGREWRKIVDEQFDCDIYVSLALDSSSYRRIRLYRVQVVHDLQPLRVWRGRMRLLFRFLIPKLLKHSDRIIAITEFVKQDILKTYPFISAEKISVVHNGVAVQRVTDSFQKDLDCKYLLYVSTLFEYKNVGTLVKSFIELKDKIPHKLVIVGKSTPYWENAVLPMIKEHGVENRVVHLSHYVSDEDIIRLYQSADIFISPSLHEGFGYTPIEAAICGTPVICTKETALPEVTMGLLNYYEPALDAIALKSKIEEVLNNYPTDEQLKKISDIFKAKYDITQQAMKFLNVLVQCSK